MSTIERIIQDAIATHEMTHAAIASSLERAKVDFDRTVEAKMATIEALDASLEENARSLAGLKQDLREVLAMAEDTTRGTDVGQQTFLR